MADIEEQIRKAEEEGKFRDLPGKGKPLKLESNVYEDPDWRVANHLLQTSGYSLPWIVLQQEIDTEWGAAKQTLARIWQWRSDSLKSGKQAEMVEAEWDRALVSFNEQVVLLNRKIRDYNLQVKLIQLQRPFIKTQTEIDRICSAQGV